VTTARATADKVLSLDDAIRWRHQAPTPVVFTNGVFDLLHAGHVDYLEAARALGGSLIVGVNSDGSAAALGKGPGRPFVGAVERARLLAALTAVDRVVVFEELTPSALIDALAPDILVKGGDYTREMVVGAEAVEARGGRVELIPLTPDRSTTSLVERIRHAS